MDRRYKKKLDRYLAKMEKQALVSIAELDFSSWFDFWHTHVDRDGKGDAKNDNRVFFLELGYKLLQILESKSSKNIQSWWQIHESSYDDAIYLHSKNDNGTLYPYNFEGIKWGYNDNQSLNGIINTSSHEIGLIVNDYGKTTVVRKIA